MMEDRDALITALMYPDQTNPHGQSADPSADRRKLALMASLLRRRAPESPMSGMGVGDVSDGLGFLNKTPGLGGGGAGGGGGGQWGGFGGSASPWDAVFSGLGTAHGAYVGNDPQTPFVPHGRQPTPGDQTLMKVGGPVGGAIGSMFGFGGSGALAGQNVGATLADLKAGNIHNLGLDVSQNLPPLPGMQQPGWKGLVNGATGLPFGTLLGKIFG